MRSGIHGGSAGAPKERLRLVAEMVNEGVRVRKVRYAFGVSPSGFYDWRARSPSARAIPHGWLTAVMTAVHTETRDSYGRECMNVELGHGHDPQIGHNTLG